MERRTGERIRAVAATGAAVLLVAVAVWLPQAMRGEWGTQLAVFSASLLQPQQGVQMWIEEWVQSGGETVPTVVVPSGRDPTSEQIPPFENTGSVPPKQDGGGTVVENVVGGGVQVADGVYVKNTSGVEIDYARLLGQEVGISFAETDRPQVLIIHTHTTESYMTYYAGYYNEGDCIRTTDCERNLCVVGEALATRLRAHGIETVHDTTVHDYPQYTGAYGRSAETVSRLLEQYPSVRLVIDLHRDALLLDDVTKVKPTATVDGKKAAQLMIIAAAGNSADAPNPYWEQNVTLALHLQQRLSTAYSELMRPLSLTESRYNQHLFPGFLLVEVGAESNTFEEAIYAATLLGDAIVTLL